LILLTTIAYAGARGDRKWVVGGEIERARGEERSRRGESGYDCQI